MSITFSQIIVRTDANMFDGQPYHMYVSSDLDISLSNTNGAIALDDLGITDMDPCGGSIGAGELVGRCLAALALADDTGTPVSVDQVPGYATYIDCGQRAGYKAERYGQILELANHVIATTGPDGLVGWC